MTRCQENPDKWFSDSPEDIEFAKDGCLDCPLSRYNACREAGWSEEFGVFGGLSHFDRKEMRSEEYGQLVAANVSAAEMTDQVMRPVLHAVQSRIRFGATKDMSPDDRAKLVEKALDLMSLGLNASQAGKELGINGNTVRWWAGRYKLTPR